MREAWIWYKQSSVLVGIPMLAVIMLTALSKVIFTGSCLTVGYQCEYAVGTAEAAQKYMTSLVGGNADIKLQPTRTDEEIEADAERQVEANMGTKKRSRG